MTNRKRKLATSLVLPFYLLTASENPCNLAHGVNSSEYEAILNGINESFENLVERQYVNENISLQIQKPFDSITGTFATLPDMYSYGNSGTIALTKQIGTILY